MGSTLFGGLVIRIPLFRVLYWDPLFSETPLYTEYIPDLYPLRSLQRAKGPY